MRSQLKALSESRFLRSKQAVKTTKISLFPSNIFQKNEKPGPSTSRVGLTCLIDLPSNSNKRSQGSNTGQREKIDAISRESIKRRQGLLSDCRLLEMSLYFTNIVFALVRDKNPLLEDMKYQFDENTENLDIRMLESGGRNNGQKWDQNSSVSACPAPLILLDCCVLVHELVRSAVALDNKNNAMKISSIQGMSVRTIIFP